MLSAEEASKLSIEAVRLKNEELERNITFIMNDIIEPQIIKASSNGNFIITTIIKPENLPSTMSDADIYNIVNLTMVNLGGLGYDAEFTKSNGDYKLVVKWKK
jgi:hypothetical protein